MSAPQSFLSRLTAARERWLRLDDEREVKIRRPAEARLPALLMRGELEDYAACAVDWRGPGWTEAGLLGAKLASETPVPFSPEVWQALALDNVRWLAAVSAAVKDDAAEFLKQREEAAKN